MNSAMSLGSKINIALVVTFLLLLTCLAPVALALYRLNDGAANDQMSDTLRFGWVGLVLGVTSLALILLAVAAMAQRALLAPLHRATTTLERVGAGDLTPIHKLERGDEFGRLSRVTSEMTDALAHMMRDTQSEQRAITASEARFRDFAEVGSDWLWETDASGRIVHFSGAFGDLSGADLQLLIGRPLGVLMQVPQQNGAARALELDSRRPLRNLICVHVTEDGREYHSRVSGKAIIGEDGAFLGYRGVGIDVTEEVQARKTADDLAYRDPLTTLANRALILERLAQALVARPISRGDVAVLFIDIDGFARINQTFGHDTGDAILIAVAERLARVAGPQDTVGRLGGDEFAIVQATGAQPEAAELLAYTLLQTLRAPFEIAGHNIQLTASIGCAIAAPEDTNEINLLRNADVARYRAKDDGCDTFRFHEPAMTEDVKSRFWMERDLRKAVAAAEIEVHYQPMVMAESRQITGFEAMIRWPRAGHGMVYPADFLPLAEQVGLSIALGEQVLLTACRTAMSWPGMAIAVNLSPAQFLDESLMPSVVRVLRETCLAPHLLELEVDERAFLSHPDRAMFQLDALRELGVRLVMDKFGSGTTSLQHLRRFHFDKLKLHKSFTADMLRTETIEVTQAVLNLAQALGLETTATGVRSEPQAALLTDLGCEGLQGKFFGKAMTAQRAFSLVRSEGLMPGAPLAETQI